MENIPPQYWPNHRTTRIPPPGVRRDPHPGVAKLPVAFKTQMERNFKEELLHPKSPMGTMKFQPPSLPLVVIQFQKFGQTALVGKVLRPPQLDIKAITICLSGIDVGEDEAAIKAATDFLSHRETSEPGMSRIAKLIGMVRNEPRPVGAHIHLDEASYDSQAVGVVTDCLVEAFFDQFGMDKIDPKQMR
jgi:hypothetical protein